jgi:Helix-turn-helix.
MNRKQFAEKLNVSESTIFNWENGKTEPTLNNLRKISEICDIPIDYISTD